MVPEANVKPSGKTSVSEKERSCCRLTNATCTLQLVPLQACSLCLQKGLHFAVTGNWPRSSPTSAPSPRIDDDKEREKNVEAEDPQQTEGEKDMEKEGLAITDEEDESSFIPITKAPSTKPTQIIIEAEDKSTEDEEEDDEQLNIDDDG
ncbi:hypothetical protein L6452_17248 [Arctium lappa]|uniref:Uncharacterized protein n=1 Tax=Arctium lappa TaxID=4217 RepID=A0ACB9C311_ARCLA|nr:hypothetical protein L6452_17248 [Arctium lappa]